MYNENIVCSSLAIQRDDFVMLAFCSLPLSLSLCLLFASEMLMNAKQAFEFAYLLQLPPQIRPFQLSVFAYLWEKFVLQHRLRLFGEPVCTATTLHCNVPLT